MGQSGTELGIDQESLFIASEKRFCGGHQLCGYD